MYQDMPNQHLQLYLPCYDIASSHEITLASFYAWNPAVKTDCSGLQANECIKTCPINICSSIYRPHYAEDTPTQTYSFACKPEFLRLEPGGED
jgi:hypothetical protein